MISSWDSQQPVHKLTASIVHRDVTSRAGLVGDFIPHAPTMVVCSSPKANTAITGAVSHCQTWHRWSIQPIGLRTLDMNIHAGELNPPPAPRPAVQSASSAGTEQESILCLQAAVCFFFFSASQATHVYISPQEKNSYSASCVKNVWRRASSSCSSASSFCSRTNQMTASARPNVKVAFVQSMCFNQTVQHVHRRHFALWDIIVHIFFF